MYSIYNLIQYHNYLSVVNVVADVMFCNSLGGEG